MNALPLFSDAFSPDPVPIDGMWFDVLGTPAPKGSARAILVNGHARMVPGGSGPNAKAMRRWDAAVREAAAAAIGEVIAPPFVAVPIRVMITFHLARPGGHYGKQGLRPSAPRYPIVAPDLDKLTRLTADALTGIVFDDDSRIVALVVEKRYALPGKEGARIGVEVVG
jgi:Holliday junction resolvase RusA-like endonuclease